MGACHACESVVLWLSIDVNPFNAYFSIQKSISLQLLAMDASARETMKDASKCDKRCEWQNSANQEKAERILRF